MKIETTISGVRAALRQARKAGADNDDIDSGQRLRGSFGSRDGDG